MNKQLESTCDVLHLSESLVRAGKVLEGRLDDILAPLGLTASQWGVLRALAEAGEALPLGEIAARLACVKSNATQLADRLEAQGLIARVANPLDRRSTQAALTHQGHARYAEGARIVSAFERERFADLEAADRAMLDDLLTRIAG